MQTLQQMIAIPATASGAQAVALTTLKILNDRSVTPDLIAFDNAAFDFVSLVGTTLTVINKGPVAATTNVWLIYFHSIERSYGPNLTQLNPAPFIIRGAGNPFGGTTPQVFRRTIVQPADGSDFFVNLPVAMPDDQYSVFPALAGAAAIVGIDCPDIAAGDRLAGSFRVITTAAPANGDFFDFWVVAR